MNSPSPVPSGSTQCAPAVLMVRPAAFGFNAQTADTNRMQRPGGDPRADAQRARAEFDAMAAAIQAAGVDVCVADDSAEPVKPDAVFANNWVSFHADGTVVLYPMLAPVRRLERREQILARVAATLGFTERRRLDLTHHELRGRYLEGTGSLVIDHRQRTVYASRSARTDAELVHEWAQAMGFTPVLFDSATPDGSSVYHTNVLLWIGERLIGVGSDWICPADRGAILERLRATGRTVVELPSVALQRFAGNMLELSCARGTTSRVLVLSASAADALAPEALQALERETGALLPVAIPTIERLGGGSVRCMLTEVPR